MKSRVWLLVIAVLLAGGCVLFGCRLAVGVLLGFPAPVQDPLDRRSLLRHFDLPSGLELVEYERYPKAAGFGQREGLNIRAVYQLSEDEAEEFPRGFVENGWLPLPVPAEIRRKVQAYVAPGTLELSAGLFFCRTAGDDVLHARETRPCAEVEWPKDAIFGALDAGTNRLHLQVGSGY
jgi:hypothetical protein